jgi:GNAT superfamily N-acetyltransferase
MGRAVVATLPKRPRGVCIKPLDASLAHRLRAQAVVPLNGDGSCSLKAMTTSCFASEHCARRMSGLTLDMLLMQPHAFVAVSDADPDGRPLPEEAFVGCVSAGPSANSLAQRLFPRRHDLCGVVLSNLCVAPAYRGHQVGRKLVEAVLGLDRAQQVNLLVARTGEGHADPNVASAFAARVPRLRATYRALDFHPIDACAQAYMLRHGEEARRQCAEAETKA